MQNKAYFGKFGGQYVPDSILSVLKEVDEAYESIANTKEFQEELNLLLCDYVGRPSPLYHAKRLSEHYGCQIYLKREDLNHTGAHKINNALAQALLAKKMGKKIIMAETGAGQHGVATATAAALLGLKCEVYMGAVDAKRQELNVHRMELLGAKVVQITDGLQTLVDATTAAINVWASDSKDRFYVIGSAVGPHPYPKMVAKFQSIIGKEARAQMKQKGIKADYLIACVGGGSNAMGLFDEFLGDEDIKMIGVEAAGVGLDTKYHAATLTKGKDGVIHGMMTKVLLEDDGSISPVYSISAGLDYPGVGPQHAYLYETKRVQYEAINDDECINALKLISRLEGIIPAVESAHALAYLEKLCPKLKNDEVVVVNLSGRGDKDMHTIVNYEKGKVYGV